MFNIVNKSLILQSKFKNVKVTKYDLNNKQLLTINT